MTTTVSGEKEAVYRLVRNLVIPSIRAWLKLRITGLGNIPKTGPGLVVVNHISNLDPLVVATVVDRAGRRPRFLAKSELFRLPVVGWALKGCGQIEVKRGTPAAPQALEEALAALARGEIVVVFPEGTVTTHPDLEPGPPKSGVIRLVLQSGAPLIPCGVWGTANVWPKLKKGSWRPRQDVVVAIGPPMEIEGDAGSLPEWRAAAGEVMAAIGALVADLRPLIPDRRRPARTPPAKRST
ncbi:lysophospholipid acyltransferase family protein [soil metagenome]